MARPRKKCCLFHRSWGSREERCGNDFPEERAELETLECPVCGETFPAGVANDDGWCEDCDHEEADGLPIGFALAPTKPPNPGRFLTLVRAIIGRSSPRYAKCVRWGCALPVGEGSEFGLGPNCDVCRYGLRAVAMPERSTENG